MKTYLVASLVALASNVAGQASSFDCSSAEAAIPTCLQSCLLAAGSSAGCAATETQCACSKSAEISASALPCAIASCQSEISLAPTAISLASAICANSCGGGGGGSTTMAGNTTSPPPMTSHTGNSTMSFSNSTMTPPPEVSTTQGGGPTETGGGGGGGGGETTPAPSGSTVPSLGASSYSVSLFAGVVAMGFLFVVML